MSAVPDPNDLQHMSLFRNLTLSELRRLNQLLRARTIAAGELVITVSEQDEASNDEPYGITYIIRQGIVKVCVDDPMNAELVVLAILGPDQVIGEMSLVGKTGYSATVIALTQLSLFWIEHAVLRECLRTMPELGYNLIGILSDRMRHANDQIQSLATLTICKRVARQIISLAKGYGQNASDGSTRIPIRLADNDLAELVGATSVRVYQVLKEFKDCKYIAVDQEHYISVLDLKGLSEVVSKPTERRKRGTKISRNKSGDASLKV